MIRIKIVKEAVTIPDEEAKELALDKVKAADASGIEDILAVESVLVDEQFELYEALQDAIDEDGERPCPQCIYEIIVDASCGCSDMIKEAEYRGRTVPIGKPMKGDVAKSKVYVTGCGKDKKRVKKVNFGSKSMKIKKHIPGRRKSFRARHKCKGKTYKKDKCTASYWSCRAW